MAKRLYLTNTAAAFSPSSYRGAWDHTINGNLALGTLPAGSSTSVGWSETSSSGTFDEGLRKFVSDGLAAGTLSGTIEVMVGAMSDNSAADMVLHVHAYVTAGDTNTVRGTLLADWVGTTEWAASTASGSGTGAQAVSSVSVSAGDRVVVEIGYRATNTVTTSYEGTIIFGGRAGPDLETGVLASTTVNRPGWVEFSDTGSVITAYPAPMRLYYGNAAAGYTPTTKRGAWDDSAASLARLLADAPTGANTSVAVSESSTTNNWDVLSGRWVSEPFTATGTITGPLRTVLGTLESSSAMNMFLHVHAFVTEGDSDTVRGTLATDVIGAVEVNAAARGAAVEVTTPSSVSAQAGDRLVIEVGYRAVNTSGATDTGTIYYGGTDSAPLYVTQLVSDPAVGWVDVWGLSDLFAGGGGSDVTGTATSTTTFGTAVTGQRRVHGAATSSTGFAAPATGTRTTAGSAARATTFGASASGVRATTGAATSATSFSAPAQGVRDTDGAATSTTSFAAPAAGHRATYGSATAPFLFTSTASAGGAGNEFGAATAEFTFATSTAGKRRVHGAATRTVTFSTATDGDRAATGTAATSATFATSATGVRTGKGAATLAVTFAAPASGTNGVRPLVVRPFTGYVVRPNTGYVVRP